MGGKEERRGIIDGANQQDQLDKLQPDNDAEKRPATSGSGPVKDTHRSGDDRDSNSTNENREQ